VVLQFFLSFLFFIQLENYLNVIIYIECLHFQYFNVVQSFFTIT